MATVWVTDYVIFYVILLFALFILLVLHIMSAIGKYLRLVKKAVIEPSDDIEQKIMGRIANLSDEDRLLLDEKFLEYLKKTNSRLYLVAKKLRNNPGKVAALSILLIFIGIFLAFSFRRRLPSSKDPSKNE